MTSQVREQPALRIMRKFPESCRHYLIVGMNRGMMGRVTGTEFLLAWRYGETAA
jgi:hypothetical protein